MKRSDVLDIIDEILYEHELPLLQGIAKEILGRLEKVGMLPPETEIVLSDGGFERYNQWESEDG